MSKTLNPKSWARRAEVLVAMVATLSLVGCQNILDVQDVDVTSDQNFVDATAIPALFASTVSAFVTAYENQVLYTGVLADEWVISGTFPTRIEVDQRDIDPGNATLGGRFPEISRARALADFSDRRFTLVDTSGTHGDDQAQIRALSGLSLVIMSEAYCEGTPMSQLVTENGQDKFEYGPPLTRDQVLDSAMARFNAALQVAPSGSDGEYLARVAMARALMDRGGPGDYAQAATTVAAVPTTFLYMAEHSNESGQNNNIWSFNINQERWSVANNEGGNGLPFRDAQDPRMLWDRTGNDTGFDRATPSYNALKYSDRPAQTPIADGVEARLIEAEAALAAGDPDGMLTILNDLRSQVGDIMRVHTYNYPPLLASVGFPDALPALDLPTTHDEQVDLLFQERGYWLWLTAHRLGDLRRLIRQYGRTQDQVFPVGPYAPNGNVKGGNYGSDVNFPIPVEEANNPQTSSDGLAQCLNRGA
jgi:hypothetical protein